MILFSELVGCFGVFTHTSDLDSAEQTQGHRPWHKDYHEHQVLFTLSLSNPYSTGGSHNPTMGSQTQEHVKPARGRCQAGPHIMLGQRPGEPSTTKPLGVPPTPCLVHLDSCSFTNPAQTVPLMSA